MSALRGPERGAQVGSETPIWAIRVTNCLSCHVYLCPQNQSGRRTMIPACPCGHEIDALLLPYCSIACRALGRQGLMWQVEPYRVVVMVYPHLVVQVESPFDLRTSTLKGARARALETERKRKQRAALRLRVVANVPIVPPMEQYSASIDGALAISGREIPKLEAGYERPR